MDVIFGKMMMQFIWSDGHALTILWQTKRNNNSILLFFIHLTISPYLTNKQFLSAILNICKIYFNEYVTFKFLHLYYFFFNFMNVNMPNFMQFFL